MIENAVKELNEIISDSLHEIIKKIDNNEKLNENEKIYLYSVSKILKNKEDH